MGSDALRKFAVHKEINLIFSLVGSVNDCKIKFMETYGTREPGKLVGRAPDS